MLRRIPLAMPTRDRLWCDGGKRSRRWNGPAGRVVAIYGSPEQFCREKRRIAARLHQAGGLTLPHPRPLACGKSWVKEEIGPKREPLVEIVGKAGRTQHRVYRVRRNRN